MVTSSDLLTDFSIQVSSVHARLCFNEAACPNQHQAIPGEKSQLWNFLCVTLY